MVASVAVTGERGEIKERNPAVSTSRSRNRGYDSASCTLAFGVSTATFDCWWQNDGRVPSFAKTSLLGFRASAAWTVTQRAGIVGGDWLGGGFRVGGSCLPRRARQLPAPVGMVLFETKPWGSQNKNVNIMRWEGGLRGKPDRRLGCSHEALTLCEIA